MVIQRFQGPRQISPWGSLTQRTAPLFQVAAEDSFLSPGTKHHFSASVCQGLLNPPDSPTGTQDNATSSSPASGPQETSASPHQGTFRCEVCPSAARRPDQRHQTSSSPPDVHGHGRCRIPKHHPQPLCSQLRNNSQLCWWPPEAPCTRLRFQSSVFPPQHQSGGRTLSPAATTLPH